MSEFALERLQRVRSSSGNDDVSPELERMIQCLQLKEQALREELREAAAALGPPPPAGGGWGWAGGPTHPLLIKVRHPFPQLPPNYLSRAFVFVS